MINYTNIPVELRQLNQWVCVNSDSKVPMRAFEKLPASSTNEQTWADFDTANSTIGKYYDYLGFVFNDNGYVGIDIDCGFDELNLLTPLGADIIGKCQSYTEISRSGRGVHIILKGKLPFKGKNNLNGVEIYQSSRYFIMTGDTLLYNAIIDNQEAIDYVLKKYFPEVVKETNSAPKTFRSYKPIWENVVNGKKIKTRPTYPKITSGSRNVCLTSIAGIYHSAGFTKAQIYAELQHINDVACEPKLDDNELKTICNSVTRYRRKL